jgi:uncharacterized membrane protein YfcA
VSIVAVLAGLFIGLIGGFMSGALGISSGGALVPLSVLFLGVDQHVAQGISLVAQVFPSSLTGLRHYVSRGRGFPLRWLWFVATGFACGGILGALLATHIASLGLRWGFVGYLALLEIALIVRNRPVQYQTTPAARTSAVTVPKLLLIGFAGGASSGLLGIGGGLALTALASAVMKVRQHQSQALSLAVTALPLTLPAAWTYLQQGVSVPPLTIVEIVVGLCIGTDLGSRIANRLSAKTLEWALLVLVAAMALFMACKAAG